MVGHSRKKARVGPDRVKLTERTYTNSLTRRAAWTERAATQAGGLEGLQAWRISRFFHSRYTAG